MTTSDPRVGRQSNRPDAGVVLCRFDDIPDGSTKLFSFGRGFERFQMFILRRGDQLLSYANDCPHVHGPLDWKPGEFLTEDGDYIICAMHGAVFQLDDGLCVGGPCRGEHLDHVPVDVIDGAIVVSNPD